MIHYRQCDISSDIHTFAWECSHRSDHNCRKVYISAHRWSYTPTKVEIFTSKIIFVDLILLAHFYTGLGELFCIFFHKQFDSFALEFWYTSGCR